MLPELEKCSRSLLVSEKSNFLNEKSRHEIHVSKHSFNYKVSVVIPECGLVPAPISRVISGFSSFYLVRDLPVHELLEQHFLPSTAGRGSFYAISCNTHIDEDNCIALLSSVVTLDLTDKSLTPGTKQYQRVLSSLKDRLVLRYDFLLTKSTSDEALQALLSRYPHEECKQAFSQQILTDIECPTLFPSDIQGKSRSCDPHHFLEWLGAVNLDISCTNASDSFVSTYVCPEPRSCVSQALVLTVTGFISPENVFELLQELSPVAWGTTEHGFLKGGENLYTFVCFSNQDYWLHMATGAQDGCPP
ncbi:hypothetical protein DNTS_002800 [Danionella cerebrum]|uniref:Uncharacterized protein n=1 Tax=Danionella cerebrum TaxID=2873325 RepID=A0A553MKY2_9TELE|nr:hypothetical protein DNTS_002800 [Danionella translucida]